MTGEWSTTVTITDEDHEAFVRLSGDTNPLHTDDLAARRLPFGRVAVHGTHVVLLALDVLAERDERQPVRVACTFRHSVGPGDAIGIHIEPTSPDGVAITVVHDVWKVAELSVDLSDGSAPRSMPAGTIDSPGHSAPRDLTASELASDSGSIAVEADLDETRTRFPHATATAGEVAIAEIVSLTRLVGMHVPGLHSLFSSFDVSFADPAMAPGPARLAYTVRRYDDRFSKATIDVVGPGMSGSLVAFVRPAPVEPTIDPVGPPGRFDGQRWLVIGGSRGLGATTALLLAAGGADVRITYRTGADDAMRIAAATGGSAHRLDVEGPDSGLDSVRADGWQPTHLAYFASPPIFDGVSGTYSVRLEARFRRVYVEAFDALLDRLDVGQLRGIVWPSTTAVEQDVPGLAEYATAKRAGEARCRELADRHRHLLVTTPRLPRLLTDQTNTFVPTDVADTSTTIVRMLEPFSG